MTYFLYATLSNSTEPDSTINKAGVRISYGTESANTLPATSTDGVGRSAPAITLSEDCPASH